MSLICYDLFKETSYIDYYQAPILAQIKDAYSKYGNLRVKNEKFDNNNYIVLTGKLPCVNKGTNVYLPIIIRIPYDYPLSQPQVMFPKILTFSSNLVIDAYGFSTPTIERWSPLGITLTEYIDELVKYYSINENYPYKRKTHELIRFEQKITVPSIQEEREKMSKQKKVTPKEVPMSPPETAEAETPKAAVVDPPPILTPEEQTDTPKEEPSHEEGVEVERNVAEGFIFSHANNIVNSCNNELTSFRYIEAQSKLTNNMIHILERHKENLTSDVEAINSQFPAFSINEAVIKELDDRAATLSIKETVDEINRLYEAGALSSSERESLIAMFEQY
jgi:hypothetical protein